MFIEANISQREWRRVWIYALVIIVLTSLPYVIGWAQQGADWRFGGFIFGAEDGYSYLGKMRLGARGITDFYLFYTPEAHSGAPLIFLPYILPGHLVGLFINDRDPALVGALTLAFHAMRVVFDALFILVLYRFIAVFLRAPRTRFLALVLATLGGGLGWLLTLLGQGNWLGSAPADFFIPEGYSFLILSGLPHLALARAALLAGLMAVMRGVVPSSEFRVPSNKFASGVPHLQGEEQDGVGRKNVSWIRPALVAVVCWLIVGLAVPFYLVIIDCILGAWGLALWIGTRRFPLRLALVGGVSAVVALPLFGYYALVFSRNAVFAQWSAQNLLPSPHPLQYIAGYILLALPAAVGAGWAWRKVQSSEFKVPSSKAIGSASHHPLLITRYSAIYALLVGWPIIVPVLVYLPLNVQRRMAEAVIVPLAILAAVGLRFLMSQSRWKRFVRPLIVAACLSSVLLLLGSLLAVLNHDRPLFQPVAEIQALDWLNRQADADAVVLAAYDTGNVLPAYTNLRPYVGHGPETMFATEKTATTERFFRSEMSFDERQALYASVNIRYIIYGDVERGLNREVNTAPNWMQDAALIYDADGYQIYQVKTTS